MTTEATRYNRGLWLLERLSLGRLRRQLLQHVQGEVLEIGIGTGANLPFYDGDSRITGLDVNLPRLSGAWDRAARRPFSITCADAQRLPFGEGRFDTVVSTLVFCSIPDPNLALGEIKRVLRPGGSLLLLEHVRGQGPLSRRITDWLHPLWFSLQHECHLNRETAAAVQGAGFEITQISRHGWGIIQMIQARPAPGGT